jgi:hypothetical protein
MGRAEIKHGVVDRFIIEVDVDLSQGFLHGGFGPPIIGWVRFGRRQGPKPDFNHVGRGIVRWNRFRQPVGGSGLENPQADMLCISVVHKNQLTAEGFGWNAQDWFIGTGPVLGELHDDALPARRWRVQGVPGENRAVHEASKRP